MDCLQYTTDMPRRKGAHLTFAERVIIQTRRKDNWSLRRIARELGCAVNTVRNEVRRGNVLLYNGKVWHSTDKYRKVIWQCNHKYGGEKCSTPHLTEDEIKAAFVKAANKALTDKDSVIETFRLIRDSAFDTSALEQERAGLTDELNIVAGLIQDGIHKNAHVAQNQADYNKEYETLTARYEKAMSRLNEAEAEIHDKNSRRKSIEHCLSLLEERKDAVTEYDVRLWHGMVEFVTGVEHVALFHERAGGKNRYAVFLFQIFYKYDLMIGSLHFFIMASPLLCTTANCTTNSEFVVLHPLPLKCPPLFFRQQGNR